MFTSILVPLDGSAESNAALPLARTVAQATGGKITLLRVVRPGDDTTIDEASDALDRIASELTQSGPRVDKVVRVSDDVAKSILEHVAEASADLVIMRTHGRGGLERMVLGSVTQQVLARSNVPVLFMRPGGRRITHLSNVLVPIDGSPGGTLALGIAVELSETTGAGLKLLEVSVPAWAHANDAYGGMSYYDPTWDEEAQASARTYVDGMVARLRAANVDAQGETREDKFVASAIVESADTANADLIVMSTRALTGPARALLGSTADAVVRAAHCPVLLVHRADEAVDWDFNTPLAGASRPAGARP